MAAFGGGTGSRITADLSVFLMSPETGERDAKACWTRWVADLLRTQPWSVGRLSRSIVQDELPAGTLKPLLSEYTLDGNERTALILYSGQPHRVVAVRRFVDFVVARNRRNSPQSGAIPLPFVGRGQHVFNNSELLWQSMCTCQRVDHCPGTSHPCRCAGLRHHLRISCHAGRALPSLQHLLTSCSKSWYSDVSILKDHRKNDLRRRK